VRTTKFYKFRPVSDDLANDHSLDALFNSYAIFSGRRNFNDLFDSKIEIVHPTPQQILTLLQQSNIKDHKRNEMNSWVSNGEFTSNGVRFLCVYETNINSLLDTYPIYSLSIHSTCNLLWAHYASSHTGFCLELEFPAEQPRKVSYREHIGSIAMLDHIKHNISLDSSIGHLSASSIYHLDASIELGERIHDALLVKLQCWSYEGEYRWLASNAMGQVPKGERFIKIKYDPQQVKTVIYGCRMPAKVKTYIRKNLPFDTEFKQAVERKDYIEIVPFDEHMHLEEIRDSQGNQE
jgi:hypothetical protein